MGELNIKVAGLEFPSPIWVAAGPPSKDADALIACAANGCGGLIAKTISQTGAKVPRPCMARPSQTVGGMSALKDSMLNVELWTDKEPAEWYTPGTGEYARILGRTDPATTTASTTESCKRAPLIASLGYNVQDMEALVPHVDPMVDGFEFSCHYTTLDEVRALARSFRAHTRKPIFAKLSPHGHDLLELARELRACGIDGFVIMNSLGPCLALDIESEQPLLGGAGGKGWLSGPAVRPIALYWVSRLAQEMPDVPVIGVGGVSTWRDAAEFILAGAWAVQVCTAAIYNGPAVFAEINTGLAEFVRHKGVRNISELRGRALKNLRETPNLVPGVSSVDPELCIYCGHCQRSCVYDAITVDKKGHTWVINPDACYGCGLCTTVCPKSALKLVERKK